VSGLDGQALAPEGKEGLRLLADLPRDAVADAMNVEFAALRKGVGKTRSRRWLRGRTAPGEEEDAELG
jgi:hypothetical protein